jgi:NAD(P)-dependent dehydrogenase (short-subunit alcohol dehydrogenase family)
MRSSSVVGLVSNGRLDVVLRCEAMTDEFSLSGAVVVVTGATRGLGRAAAEKLVQAGARVVLVGRSTAEAPHKLFPGTVEGVEEELRAAGGDVLGIAADLSVPEGREAVVARTLEWAGRCDVLVNNASYTPEGTFFSVPSRRWLIGFNVTVVAAVELCQAFVPGMLERGHGRVLNVGSGSATYYTEPAEDWEPYGEGFGPPLLYPVTKAALERLTIGLNDEFGDRGVSFVNLRAGKMTSESYRYLSGRMGYHFDFDRVHDSEEAARGVMWMLRQPVSYSGRIVDFLDLMRMGVIPDKPDAW